jgi:DNA-binding transcriptional activator of the SARP family
MKLHDLLDQAYQAFHEQSANAQVVLLHPRSRYRSVLVARLINTPTLRVFYYAMGPDDINVSSFLAGITHDLALQHPMFGRHISMLSPGEQADLDTVVGAFVRDLSEVSAEPFLLVLDEYDRSDSADDVQTFVERLIGQLPSHCKLVINSRTLPRLPWVSLIAQKQAILLEDDRLIARDFYDIEAEGKNRLEVFALGPGYVLLNGQMIEAWEGHLPRLLFFFALDRPSITRSEICQAFWPELEIDQAVNVFHVTKRRLHKALDMDVLVHDGGYYRVNPDLAIRYDVMDFVGALMAGRDEDNPNRMAAWQKAVELYRGPFLQGHNDPWIIERRRDFQAGYLEALSEMARARLAEDRPEHALGLFQRALNEDSTREDIHREVMRLYAQMGRRSEAAAHFQRLVEELDRVGRKPEDETQRLYDEIMR